MAHCTTDEGGCTEVKDIKAYIRRLGYIFLTVALAIGGGALYTWANSLKVPDLVEDSQNHNDRIIVLEVTQKQILKNTEEIKEMIEDQNKSKCPTR